MGCLPVYTLSEFASSQRQLPVSTNRPQGRSKARALSSGKRNWGWPVPPLCNGRVEIDVESWGMRRIKGTEAEFQGTPAVVWLCLSCPAPSSRKPRSPLHPWILTSWQRLSPAPPLCPQQGFPGLPPGLGLPPEHGSQQEERREKRRRGFGCGAVYVWRGVGGEGGKALPSPGAGPHLCPAQRAGGAGRRGAQARRRLSLTHSRGRNADGRAALWSRLRPTDGGRRPGTQPVGLGSPPSC